VLKDPTQCRHQIANELVSNISENLAIANRCRIVRLFELIAGPVASRCIEINHHKMNIWKLTKWGETVACTSHILGMGEDTHGVCSPASRRGGALHAPLPRRASRSQRRRVLTSRSESGAGRGGIEVAESWSPIPSTPQTSVLWLHGRLAGPFRLQTPGGEHRTRWDGEPGGGGAASSVPRGK
jgi:hypothetical protein